MDCVEEDEILVKFSELKVVILDAESESPVSKIEYCACQHPGTVKYKSFVEMFSVRSFW